jgi:hypothetical protein
LGAIFGRSGVADHSKAKVVDGALMQIDQFVERVEFALARAPDEFGFHIRRGASVL